MTKGYLWNESHVHDDENMAGNRCAGRRGLGTDVPFHVVNKLPVDLSGKSSINRLIMISDRIIFSR